MWKMLLIFTLAVFPASGVQHVMASSPPSLMEETPPYAKWGRIAMEKTKEKYPAASIIDYLHIGRDTEGDQATEKFKLWLRTKDKEFGVYVSILFKTDTEKIVKIDFQETDR